MLVRSATAIVAFAVCAIAMLSVSPAIAEDVAGGEPIELYSKPVRLSRNSPARIRFGELTWRGGIVLDSPSNRFGGFSGLVMSRDGRRVIAVSDRGWWFTARLDYRDGHLSGASDAAMAPLLDADGKRDKKKQRRDAEALAAFDAKGADGLVLVGFERQERIEMFNVGALGFLATPIAVEMPKAVSTGRHNGELESVARLREGPLAGWFIAISERNFDSDGNLRGWRWKGENTVEFSLTRHEDYLITDIVPLPGGEEFVTLERSFVSNDERGMVMRRFRIADLKPRRVPRGTKLLELRHPSFAFDNMEGLGLHRTEDGEIRLTLISDDNYNRGVQRTLLFQFALR